MLIPIDFIDFKCLAYDISQSVKREICVAFQTLFAILPFDSKIIFSTDVNQIFILYLRVQRFRFV